MDIKVFFNFPYALKQTFNKENYLLLRAVIKEEIINQISADCTNRQKMRNVKLYACNFVKKYFKSSNIIVNYLLSLLVKNMEIFTQAIYDDLKLVVEEL